MKINRQCFVIHSGEFASEADKVEAASYGVQNELRFFSIKTTFRVLGAKYPCVALINLTDRKDIDEMYKDVLVVKEDETLVVKTPEKKAPSAKQIKAAKAKADREAKAAKDKEEADVRKLLAESEVEDVTHISRKGE